MANVKKKPDHLSGELFHRWHPLLEEELKKEYMVNLFNFISGERSAGKIVYPPDEKIFNAFKRTPFDRVKVVIIGQDPYHGKSQAHGLSFSVRPEVKIPPSLRNIFKEIHNDLGIEPAASGSLYNWADQGVFLLNSVLTVEAGKPSSHKKMGWETFTDKVVSLLNESSGIVFMLWGNYAIKKGRFIDTDRHLILSSKHPSPFSANSGFFGNHHFSKTNTWLYQQNRSPIDWQLPSL